MCPNLEEARENRERIADKELNREYWDELEATLRATRFGKLPASVPIGSLPEVGGKFGRRVSDNEEVLSLEEMVSRA